MNKKLNSHFISYGSVLWTIVSFVLWRLSGQGALTFCFPHGTPIEFVAFLLILSLAFMLLSFFLRKKMQLWVFVFALLCFLTAMAFHLIFANEILYAS